MTSLSSELDGEYSGGNVGEFMGTSSFVNAAPRSADAVFSKIIS